MSHVLVIDASVVVDLIARFRPQPLEACLWAPGAVLAAPELLDIEVLHALCKLDQAGAIPAPRRGDLPLVLRALRIRKYRHETLLDGIWALRDNLTAYAAAYVALARVLDAPLMTRDQRLAQVQGLGVVVTVP